MSDHDPYGLEALDSEYAKLCTQRDSIENRIAPLRARLRAAADAAEVERVKAMQVVAELDAAFAEALLAPPGRGKGAFMRLKNRIGRIAKMRQEVRNKEAAAGSN